MYSLTACKNYSVFLQVLSIDKCSLLGWSDGGITALFMAAKYPQFVDKLVIWGANAYITDEDIELYESKFLNCIPTYLTWKKKQIPNY